MAKRVREDEWLTLVRVKVGPVLAELDFSADRSEQTSSALNSIKASLDLALDDFGYREHVFGCVFMNLQEFSPLQIGAVRIESRLDWLARIRKAGNIDEVTHRRIERAWNGKKLRSRKPSSAQNNEYTILKTTSDYPYVICVGLSGHAQQAGKEQGILLSKVVLAALSLFWKHPSTFLQGARLSCERGEWIARTMTFGENNFFGYSFSRHRMPMGAVISTEDWSETIRSHQEFLSVIAEISEKFLAESTDNSGRAKVMHAVLQSLLWLHKACAEEDTALSLVAYSAALDSLSGGKKARGIKLLINAQLGIDDNQSLYQGGPTLSEFVNEMFNNGRSRLVHGTSEKIGHDWSRTLVTAESLTRHALYSCITNLSSKPLLNSLDQLKEK